MSEIVTSHDIDEETGKKMYEVCDYCNYDRHLCHWCGEYLTHSGHDTEDIYHDTAYCRPDLVEHEPGKLCTWPDHPELNKYREPGCYWDHERNELRED